MYKFKIITDKEISKLEGALNSGWELAHTVVTEKIAIFVLRQKK